MRPLPETVTAITKLEPPKDTEELRHLLGLVGFYRKFIPFLADVTVCLNTMLQKGAVFTWIEQYGIVIKLLKSELLKMFMLQYPNPNKPFKLFTNMSKHSYLGILLQEKTPGKPGAEANLILIAYFSGSFGRA